MQNHLVIRSNRYFSKGYSLERYHGIKIKRKAPVLLLKTSACTGAAKLSVWFTFAFPEFTLTTPP